MVSLCRYIVLYNVLILSFCTCQTESNKSVKQGTGLNTRSILTDSDNFQKKGFPKSWIGNWRGELVIDNREKDTLFQIPMELNIAPTQTSGRWQWQLVYNGSPRDYELVAFKTEEGLFKMDEQNSIILDQQLFGNTFFSRYDVAGNLILVSNQLFGEEMLFEVIFSRNDSTNITGGEGEVPIVTSYPISVYQRAVLKKE